MNARILIIESDYYAHITEKLRLGAEAVLANAGAEVGRIIVPGVLEIPAALAMAVEADSADGYVLLGCVIRGETSHYDIVAGESARAVMNLTIAEALAVGNGILTVENEAQALVRADPHDKDKGGDAARAALAMVDIRQALMAQTGEQV